MKTGAASLTTTLLPCSVPEMLRASVRDRPEREVRGWHASSLGMCPRATYYERIGVQQTTPFTEALLMRFSLGHVVHEWVYRQVREMANGRSVETEVELPSSETGLTGTLDLLLEAEDGKTELWDVKSQNALAFGYMPRDKNGQVDQDGLRAKYPHMVQQVTAYAMMLEDQGRYVDRAYVLLLGVPEMLTQVMRVWSGDESVRESVRTEVEQLQTALDGGELPPCTCETWKMEGCRYGDIETRKAKRKKPRGRPEYVEQVNTQCCLPALAESTGLSVHDGLLVPRQSPQGAGETAKQDAMLAREGQGRAHVWGQPLGESRSHA